MNYVCGFAFNKYRSQVALILKNRPEFLKGKYNGIGGKVESNDNDFFDAMVREFEEECGVLTTRDQWINIGYLDFNGGVVEFFKSYLEDEQFDAIRTMEDEEIHKISITDLKGTKIDSDAVLFLEIALRDNVRNLTLRLN